MIPGHLVIPAPNIRGHVTNFFRSKFIDIVNGYVKKDIVTMGDITPKFPAGA